MATTSTAGAYVNPADYGSGTTMAQAISQLNALTARSISGHRTYYGAGSVPTAISADLQADAAAGRRALISLKPDYSPVSSTQRTQLGQFCTSCKQAGLDAVFALWHEPYSQGLTAAQYITMMQYYAPTIRASYPVSYSQATYPIASGKIGAGDYFPGTAYCDQVTVDYYCDSYLLNTGTLASCAAVADANSLPFGIWEYNKNAASQSNAQVLNYMINDGTHSILAFFTARIAAPKPVADVAWFQNSAQSNAPAILSAGDFRVPAYQQIFDLITGIVPPVPPTPGNLIMSLAPSPGTDPYGNAYPAGLYLPSSIITGQPWFPLTPGNGWTNIIYYRLTSDNELELWSNALTAPGSSANGVTIVTLPAGYRPPVQMQVAIAAQSNTGAFAHFTLATTGTLQATGVLAGSGVVLNARVPLDLP